MEEELIAITDDELETEEELNAVESVLSVSAKESASIGARESTKRESALACAAAESAAA